jgi:hypothetical protein
LLIKRGAKPSMVTKKGVSALDVATKLGIDMDQLLASAETNSDCMCRTYQALAVAIAYHTHTHSLSLSLSDLLLVSGTCNQSHSRRAIAA